MCQAVSFGSEHPNDTPDKSKAVTSNFQQRSNNQTKTETIDKLRQFGLSDEQIAEALKLPLEVVKQENLEW
jgi:predicted transposase YdaD